MIQVKGISKTYLGSTGQTALKGIDSTFEDKGLIFILGRSGSGKSTLLNILGTLDTPTSGNIEVDGYRLGENGIEGDSGFRNGEIGFIFQDFCLMESFSVYENVASSQYIKYGKVDETKIDEILRDLGMLEFKSRGVQKLSAGQRQRVAIARALAKDPKIILCDEPTGNLDFSTTRQILETLQKVSREKLVLVVSHNVSDAYRYAERIIELNEGNVISDKVNPYVDEDYVLLGDTLYLSDVSSLDEGQK